MAAAALFAPDVVLYVTLISLVLAAVLEVIALVNCLTQRADAFQIVGSLSKNAWLAILGGATFLTLLCGVISVGSLSIFAIIGITAAAVYLLDVRPALRDATDGSGNW
jgi:Protein of unknown function (DUF2516)